MFKIIYKHLILGFFNFMFAIIVMIHILINSISFDYWLHNTMITFFGETMWALLFLPFIFLCLSPFIWIQSKIDKNRINKTKHIVKNSKYIHHYDLKKEPIYYYSSDGGFSLFMFFTLIGGLSGMFVYLYFAIKVFHIL